MAVVQVIAVIHIINSLHWSSSTVSGLKRNLPRAMSQTQTVLSLSLSLSLSFFLPYLLLSSRLDRIFFFSLLSRGRPFECEPGCTLHFLVQYLTQSLLPACLSDSDTDDTFSGADTQRTRSWSRYLLTFLLAFPTKLGVETGCLMM